MKVVKLNCKSSPRRPRKTGKPENGRKVIYAAGSRLNPRLKVCFNRVQIEKSQKTKFFYIKKEKKKRGFCTYHDKIPHFCSFSNSRTHRTASGKQHQLLGLIVEQIVHDACTQARFTLKYKRKIVKNLFFFVKLLKK